MKTHQQHSPAKPADLLQEVILWVFIIAGGFYIAQVNYLVFHTSAELFSILVSGSIFTLSWNSRRFFSGGYFVLIGVAYLFISLIDLAHTMSYKGMPLFHDGDNVDWSIQLWIASRYIESLSLLMAPLLIKKTLSAPKIFWGYLVVTMAVFLSIFTFDLFPHSFIEGQGLTPFKRVSEYIICLILAGSILLLHRTKDSFDPRVLALMYISTGLTICSELSFTLYSNPYGLANWFGHIFKILSFYLIYKAIIKTGLQEPFSVLFRDIQAKEEQLALANSELEKRVQERTAELAQSEAQFRTLADLSPVGIFRTTPLGQLTFVNQRWSDIAGIEAEQALSTDWLQALHPEDQAKVTSLWEQSISQEQAFLAEFRFLTPSGETTWVLGQSKTIVQQNLLQGYVGALTNITHSKQRESELAAAKSEAEAANQAKTAFLSMMSHELRTPMNGILGMAQILLLSDLTPDQRTECEIIIKSGENLTSILNDILDLSKVEAGRQVVTYRPFNVEQVVVDIAELFAGAALMKNLRLTYDIDSNIEMSLIGDPDLLRRALLNLVGNAIKFTEKGEISINLEAVQSTDESQSIRFKVLDTGIGIAKDKQGNIFDPFQQVDGSYQRQFGGTGLGLAIVKQLIELMGGQITIDSAPERGSCFTIDLEFSRPVHTSSNGFVTHDDSQGHTPLDPAKVLVLLVEDDEVNQTVIKKMLANLNIQCDIAKDGSEALILSYQKEYSMLFMDLLMPKVDGFEATSAIRSTPANPNHAKPIIALTALTGDKGKQRCFEVGMNEFLTKPVDFELLKAVIDKYKKST